MGWAFNLNLLEWDRRPIWLSYGTFPCEKSLTLNWFDTFQPTPRKYSGPPTMRTTTASFSLYSKGNHWIVICSTTRHDRSLCIIYIYIYIYTDFHNTYWKGMGLWDLVKINTEKAWFMTHGHEMLWFSQTFFSESELPLSYNFKIKISRWAQQVTGAARPVGQMASSA